MYEERIPVRPFRVYARCECGGTFFPAGIVLTTFPPLYPHRCEDCRKTKEFESVFPYVDYVEVEED